MVQVFLAEKGVINIKTWVEGMTIEQLQEMSSAIKDLIHKIISIYNKTWIKNTFPGQYFYRQFGVLHYALSCEVSSVCGAAGIEHKCQLNWILNSIAL